MSVKKHPSQPGYIIDCRPDGYKGKRYRVHLKTATQAEAEAEERIFMRKGPKQEPVTAKRIAAIYPQWISWYRANKAKRTSKDAMSCFKLQILPFFGNLRPRLLTRAIVEQYKSKRIKEDVKKRTINKELAYFSSMLKWAAENDFCDPVPFAVKGYPNKQTKAPRPRP